MEVYLSVARIRHLLYGIIKLSPDKHAFFLNSYVLLVNSEASNTSTNITGIIFIKELNDVSSVTSGGLHQVKAEHNAHRI